MAANITDRFLQPKPGMSKSFSSLSYWHLETGQQLPLEGFTGLLSGEKFNDVQ
jgi:hypothetical protein